MVPYTWEVKILLVFNVQGDQSYQQEKNKQTTTILREVQLPIISNEQSMFKSSGQDEWIPNIFLSAGTASGGKDACDGDAGDPLVVKSSNGRFTLAGAWN